jgi:hypothetical protein
VLSLYLLIHIIMDLSDTGINTRSFPMFIHSFQVGHSILQYVFYIYLMSQDKNSTNTTELKRALDECKLSDEVRSKFMSAIFNIQAKASANLFATSRFIPHIEEEFKRLGAVSLEIYASDRDVGRYLDGRISRLPPFVQECPGLIDQVKAAIIEAANEM